MRFPALAAILAVAMTSTGQAQQPDSTGKSSDIVVTGTRDLERQVRDFVNALTPTSPRGQLARFEHHVCPLVVGLQGSQKTAVEQRMRVVAKAAGMDVAKADCVPNAILIVTNDKKQFISKLSRTKGEYFGDLSGPQVRRIANEPGASSAWQLKTTVTGDGVRPNYEGDVGFQVNRTTRAPSRTSAPVRPVFEASAVVIESEALFGLSTTQLADYAAMRLFAGTEPSRLEQPPPPTILAVLDAPADAQVPVSLTRWDLGFLRGLYSSTNNLYAPSQRSEISKGIVEELREESAD